jgi:IS30 family transposase
MSHLPPYLTVKEIAAILGKHTDAVLRYIRRGKLKYHTKLAGAYIVLVEDFEEFHERFKNKDGIGYYKKLTKEKVKEIRKLHAQGKSYKYLAEQFEVSRGTINSVVNNRSWKGE